MKGGGVSGESFSLSCPSRLVVQAGSSIVLSCSATAVPEEGVRYEWESFSGDGFHLLSASDELSPLFTAPLSGESAEYGYRLTAMGAGVYATASVTVTVQGVPGESVGAPVIQEDCDPFTIPDELGEGCAEDKGPVPFGFGPESEGGFLFPEVPGLPDRPSGPVRGGGFDSQTPPRLECPVAVFLEELQTGAIECHAWDASGEEYLDYSWEPVGSTTRDYLDNPRLMPEDAPNPSVVAPEVPAYETLESFRSGETTFRYRYRLTATSRATGLSSFSEVEVFVSSSRPSVYCPLEVVVEEGETISLDCEGADPLSSRMDYDEEGASILWEWEGLWGTGMAPLDATHLSSPLFTAPSGSAGKEYHYIASMTSSASGVPRTARRRVTVTVTGGEGTQAAADASALSAGGPLALVCHGGTTREVDEGSPDEVLKCDVSGEHAFASARVRWDTRPGTPAGSLARLSRRDTALTMFTVPDDVVGHTDYKYKITAFGHENTLSQNFTITVLDTDTPPVPVVMCNDADVGEDDFGPGGSFELDCSVTDEPTGATYAWAARGSTTNTNRLQDSSMNSLRATFNMPLDPNPSTNSTNEDSFVFTYEYRITLSAPGIDDVTADVTIKVRDEDVHCWTSSTTLLGLYKEFEVDEGAGDLLLETCKAGVTSRGGPPYVYNWAGTGQKEAGLLTATDQQNVSFKVPSDLSITTEYTFYFKVIRVVRS